jgi:hypothetical protein
MNSEQLTKDAKSVDIPVWTYRTKLTPEEILKQEEVQRNDLITRLKVREVARLLDIWSRGKTIQKSTFKGINVKDTGLEIPNIVWKDWAESSVPPISIYNIHEWREFP